MPSILKSKNTAAPSVFRPAALLREARRQKNLPAADVPAICIPFRETAEAIDAAKSKGVLAVEMEAAALYAFASSAKARVLCLAHVTNTMGQAGDDFEKGEADGTRDALTVLENLVSGFQTRSAMALTR